MWPVNGKGGIQTQAVDAKPVPLIPKLHQLPGGKKSVFSESAHFGVTFSPFPHSCLPTGVLGALSSPGWEQGDSSMHHSRHCCVWDHRRPGYHNHVCNGRDPERREQRDLRGPQVHGEVQATLPRNSSSAFVMLSGSQKCGYLF